MLLKPSRLVRVTLTSLLLLLICVSLVRAFAEEPITFRDPYTHETTDEEISTIHTDLTYALALAAGFTVQDAITLQVWNQLVDSEQLGPGEGISYTNCLGAFYPTPDASTVCTTTQGLAQVAWPAWSQMQDAQHCVTSRFGPYSPFFHFPHPGDLQALHDWGWGLTSDLVGYEAYAWGAMTVMQATCRYTRTAVITTSIEAGSLPAFTTYLHSLADYYSHRECIAAMDALGMPWATHTNLFVNNIPACNYSPSNPNKHDAHGREFGTASITDSQRTDEAILAVYSELVVRSQQREGVYVPLSLDTPLQAMSGTPTLRDALYAFVHNWNFDQPQNRRDFADQIAHAVLAQRQAIQPTATPTSTPMIVCTPPPCPTGGVLYCPDSCPGGCGYRCAMPTATPTVANPLNSHIHLPLVVKKWG
jgi:hypothetical protein